MASLPRPARRVGGSRVPGTRGGGTGRGQGKLYHCTCTHTCGGDGWVAYSTMTSHRRRQRLLDRPSHMPTVAATTSTAAGMESEVSIILFGQ